MTKRIQFLDLPDQYPGYVDFFSDTERYKEPVILQDGTGVLFPAGWTDEDADKWRKGREVQRPEGFTPGHSSTKGHAND